MMNLFILLVVFGVVSSSFAAYDVQLEASYEVAEVLKTASGISDEKDKVPNSLFHLEQDQDPILFKTQTLQKYPNLAEQGGTGRDNIAEAKFNEEIERLPHLVSKSCYCEYVDRSSSFSCNYSPRLTSICDSSCTPRKEIYNTATHGALLPQQRSVILSTKDASYTALYSTAQFGEEIGRRTKSMLYRHDQTENNVYCSCTLIKADGGSILCSFDADLSGKCSDACPERSNLVSDGTVLPKYNSLIVPTRAASYTFVSHTKFPYLW